MNQFGGSVGGPVVLPKLYNGKNRTFFFFNYEGTRWRRGAVFINTVPTAAERLGRFFTRSDQLRPSHHHLRSLPALCPTRRVAGQYIRTPFAGNIIPCEPNQPDWGEHGVVLPLARHHRHRSARVAITTSVTREARSTRTSTMGVSITSSPRAKKSSGGSLPTSTALCQPNTYGNLASPAAASVGCTTFKNRSATLEDDYTISPNVLFTVRYGFARWYQIRAGLSYGFNQTTLGFPASLVSEEQVPGFPTVNVSGYGGLGNQGNNYLSNGNDTHSLLPSLTIVHGRQVIKAGADLRLMRINFFNPSSPGGTYTFTAAFTQGPNPLASSNAAGDAFASLLLGTPQSGSLSIDTGVSMQNYYYAGYVQDDIKISDRLTVNAGLRYETESPYTERHNRMVGFDAKLPSPAANPAFPNLTGGLVFANPSDRYVYDWYKKGFGPRLGLAYNIAKHTVIRAGAGFFYAPLQISNNAVGFSPSSGFSSSTPLNASINGGLTPFTTFANAFSGGEILPTGNSLGAATFLGQGITVWDSHPITPRSYQWNFDVQHQLPWNVLIDAAYVGNRGVYLAGNRQFDAMPPQYLSKGTALLASVPNPFYGKISNGTLAQSTVTYQSLLTPFPQFSAVDLINDTYGNSTYHAFQLKVEKRLSSGLSFLVAYTFSKLITDIPWAASTIGGDNGSGVYQNWYNLAAERALSAQDFPQTFTISYDYALPFGKGKALGGKWHGPVQWLLGNWALNGITRLSSGSPLALSTSVNNVHDLAGNSRPNSNGQNATLHNRNIYEWFNTATFTQPAAFTFGNVSRTINVFSPGIINFDASLFKNMIFHERYTLQFRAEFFNLFNRENFDPPDTTLGDKTFGQISASNLLPRVGQLALKLTF